jgi:hypothetical protein
MSILNWLKKKKAKTRPRTQAGTRCYRPCLEELEGRVTPSTWTVTNTAASTATSGSLPWAVLQADQDTTGNAVVVFAPALSGSTITLSSTLTLKNLNFTKSTIQIAGPPSGVTLVGGGKTSNFPIIKVEANTTAVLNGLTLRGGVASQGAAVYSAGTLSIQNCTITANAGSVSASPLSTGYAGAVYNSGTMAILNCTFSNNVASDANNNAAYTNSYGGAVYNAATLTVTNSTFTGNVAYSRNGSAGGAIFNSGSLALAGCTLSGNGADYSGGAIAEVNGTLAIANSTISGNVAGAGGGAGIVNYSGTVIISNSTVSGNNAATGSGPGGAIFNYAAGSLNLTNVTIYSNAATTGGGIYNYSSTLLLKNTIVAGNAATSSGGQADLDGNAADPTSAYNLIGVAGTSGLTNGSNGNIVGVGASSLGLAALANHGGATPTIALLPGSPALGAGSAALVVGTTDQRGLSRFLNGTVDIGAFESQGFNFSPAGGSNQAAWVNTGFPVGLTVSVTANNAAEPVNGGRVTFAAPAAGASAVLSTTSAVISGGVATVSASANGTPGTYTVLANNLIPFSLTNVPVSTLGGLSATAWTVNQAGYSGTISIAGGSGTFTNLIVTGLPTGLSAALSGAVITISGTPTQAGAASVTVSVVDTGVTVQKIYGLTINAAPGLGTLSPNLWTINQSSSSTVAITGGTGPFSLGTVTGLPAGASIALSGKTITISGTPTQIGVYTIGIQATDAAGATLNGAVGLSVEYPPPTLQPIGLVTFPRIGPYLSVNLIGGNTEAADIPNFVYSVRVIVDDAVYKAYQLTQSKGLSDPGHNFYFNTRGVDEKYLLGTGNTWFYVLPGGGFYQWGGSLASSTLLATFPTTFWTDPNAIVNASPTDVSATYTTVNGNGTTNGQMSFVSDAIQTFAGTLHVQATVTDGYHSATQSFDVVVTNVPPTLQPLSSPVTFEHSGPYPSVTLDGEAAAIDLPNVIYSAKVYQDAPYRAVQARQTYGLTNPGSNFYFNARGAKESYFVGTGATWYYILPSGALYQWGGSLATSTLLANLGSTYGANPDLVLTATLQDMSATYVSVSGHGTTSGQIDFKPAAMQNFVGTLHVVAGISDGIAFTSQAFDVTVTDSLSLQPISSPVSIPHSGPYPTIDLLASDALVDVPSLDYSVKVYQETAYQAYQVRQTYGLANPGSNFYFNARGAKESYFVGTGATWYYILPSGALYQWGGSLAASTLLANLGSTYGANPALLLATSLQDLSSTYVTVSGAGTDSGHVDFNPIAMQTFIGTLRLQASVTDGVATATQSFMVNVTDNLSLQAISSPIVVAHDGILPTINLNAGDDDSDTANLVYSVKVFQDTPAYQAYALRQIYGFLNPGGNYYFNTRGMSEKYLTDSGNHWYFILPNGALYQWGGSFGASTQLATLNTAMWSAPNLLWNALPPVDAAAAFNLQQTYGLANPGRSDFYFNARGLNEKYLVGAGNQWYFMLTNGALYKWGGTIASSTLVGTLNAAIYDDLNLLLNAQAIQDVAGSFTLPPSGNGTTTGQLDLNAAAINTFNHGKLHILASVTDGIATATQSFDLIVT